MADLEDSRTHVPQTLPPARCAPDQQAGSHDGAKPCGCSKRKRTRRPSIRLRRDGVTHCPMVGWRTSISQRALRRRRTRAARPKPRCRCGPISGTRASACCQEHWKRLPARGVDRGRDVPALGSEAQATGLAGSSQRFRRMRRAEPVDEERKCKPERVAGRDQDSPAHSRAVRAYARTVDHLRVPPPERGECTGKLRQGMRRTAAIGQHARCARCAGEARPLALVRYAWSRRREDLEVARGAQSEKCVVRAARRVHPAIGRLHARFLGDPRRGALQIGADENDMIETRSHRLPGCPVGLARPISLERRAASAIRDARSILCVPAMGSWSRKTMSRGCA